MSAVIRVEGVAKAYGDVRAVDHVSLEVGANECLALLGPSGCGKTTLLRLMAGLETPDAGAISIGGADMTRTPPYGRPVNMMFQSYALFPHMSVADNVAFGLKQDRLAPAEIDARTREALAAVELEALGARKPHQLSGGQRQRVALARCIAKRPKALLLDEPMAALDKHLRERTQLELLALRRRLGISFVVVTHDQDEAMTMADRIAVMDKGRILQIDTPRKLYEHPVNQAVARFFGDINLWPNGRAVRPEHIALSCVSGDVEGVVTDIIYRGAGTTYLVRTQEMTVRVLRQNARGETEAHKGDTVFLSWPADAARTLSP
ncbi:MAG: ABC transporter ATP-binding protein [Rhodospirillaceae bacterium]|nr:ABC transporter ATP-binding protein [Rhodospirillaceae bacterium]